MHQSKRQELREMIRVYGVQEVIDTLGQIIDGMAGNATTKYRYQHLLAVASELDKLADKVDPNFKG